MTPIDIHPADLETVRRILRDHVPVLEVRAFGSRVAWNARETSDLDLAVMTDEPLSIDRTVRLRAAFTDSDLPFRVDIVDWATASESFRKRIRANHVVLRGHTVEVDTSTKPSVMVRVDATGQGDRDGWHETTLGDVITLKRGYDLPQRHRMDGPVPVVSSSGIIDHHRESRVSGPGVVTGRYGTLGQVFFIPDDFWPLNTALYVRDFKGNDPRFISYFLRSLDFSAYSDKAAVPGLNRNHLHQESVRIPAAIDEQRGIAHILGTLDDKIELNRRMNATLEAMAWALFRSWFVDFDPVRAKMAGRDTGLPKDIADLFPNRQVDSALGEIPEGWRVRTLDDAVELLNGGTPRTSVARFWNGDIPWYTAKDAPLPRDVFVVKTERNITQAGVDNSATSVLPPRTTVITARGTVGRLACLGRPIAMNQTCYGIRGAGGYRDFFVYWLVRRTVEELRSRTHGTIFDTITRETFTLVDLALPPVSVAEAFESAVAPAMARILSNLHEISVVAALRDTLLPKLVSGELRVNAIEPACGRDEPPVPVEAHGA